MPRPRTDRAREGFSPQSMQVMWLQAAAAVVLLPLIAWILVARFRTAIETGETIVVVTLTVGLVAATVGSGVLVWIVVRSNRQRREFLRLVGRNPGSVTFRVTRSSLRGDGDAARRSPRRGYERFDGVRISSDSVQLIRTGPAVGVVAQFSTGGATVELVTMPVGRLEVSALRFVMEEGRVDVTAAPDRVDRYSDPPFDDLEQMVAAIRELMINSNRAPD